MHEPILSELFDVIFPPCPVRRSLLGVGGLLSPPVAIPRALDGDGFPFLTSSTLTGGYYICVTSSLTPQPWRGGSQSVSQSGEAG